MLHVCFVTRMMTKMTLISTSFRFQSRWSGYPCQPSRCGSKRLETNTSQNAKTFETLTLWSFNSSTLPNSGLCQMSFHQTLAIFRVYVRWELAGLASVPSTAIRSCSAQFDEWPKATLVRSPGGVWCVHATMVDPVLMVFLKNGTPWDTPSSSKFHGDNDDIP